MFKSRHLNQKRDRRFYRRSLFFIQNFVSVLTISKKNDRIFDRVCLIMFSSQTFVTLSGAGGGDF